MLGHWLEPVPNHGSVYQAWEEEHPDGCLKLEEDLLIWDNGNIEIWPYEREGNRFKIDDVTITFLEHTAEGWRVRVRAGLLSSSEELISCSYVISSSL